MSTTPIVKIHRLAAMLASEIPPSISYMAKALNLNRTTIREHRLRINELGYSFKEFASLPFNDIERVLKHEPKIKSLPNRHTNLLTIFGDIYKGYIDGKTDLKTIWTKYRQDHPDGYGYSHFTDLFHTWQKEHGYENLPVKKWNIQYISEEDLVTLNKWYRSNNKLRWAKAVVILDSHQGATIDNLCVKVGRGRRMIERWINAFREKGLDGIRSPEGRNKNPEMLEKIKSKRDRIIEILHESPRIHGINRASWSLVTLSRAYETFYRKSISISTISEYIRAEHYSFRKARIQLTSPDPNYREKLEAITKILSNLSEDEKFFSIDEFGPFAVKKRGGRSYTQDGTVRVVPQWQSSRGSLILTGALELSTNQMTHFYSKKKNTDEMIKLMEILLEQYSNQRCLYLSWDAASWHISAKLAKRVKEVNAIAESAQHQQPIVKLAPLPSSAQFLNVIESVFSGMAKAELHNSDYQTVEECKSALDTYIADRNENYKQHPRRAGDKIWGKELVEPSFNAANNCKDPKYR